MVIPRYNKLYTKLEGFVVTGRVNNQKKEKKGSGNK